MDVPVAVRLLVGVIAAVVALPFLFILWSGLNVVFVGLFITYGPGWFATAAYYLASALLVALDVWIGYQASRFGR